MLKPKNTAGGTVFLDLKLYYIAIVMKIIRATVKTDVWTHGTE